MAGPKDRKYDRFGDPWTAKRRRELADRKHYWGDGETPELITSLLRKLGLVHQSEAEFCWFTHPVVTTGRSADPITFERVRTTMLVEGAELDDVLRRIVERKWATVDELQRAFIAARTEKPQACGVSTAVTPTVQ